MNDHKIVSDLIEEKKQQFTDISDSIWGYSEIKYEEVRSAEILGRMLEAEGFQVEWKCRWNRDSIGGEFW